MPDDKLKLETPFYRATSRALILDSNDKLIIVKDNSGGWQLPGGGLEHGETFAECVAREVKEELSVGVLGVSPIIFTYQARSGRGHMILRMAAHVIVDSYNFRPSDDMVDWKAVSRAEFMSMDFIAEESNVKDFVESIWQVSGKVD